MYKLTKSEFIIRVGDNSFIPKDSENKDYRDYCEWLAAGNIPDEADDTNQPDPIAMRQAAYRAESDPIFMEARYDDDPAKMQEWKNKVVEIKERYPL